MVLEAIARLEGAHHMPDSQSIDGGLRSELISNAQIRKDNMNTNLDPSDLLVYQTNHC